MKIVICKSDLLVTDEVLLPHVMFPSDAYAAINNPTSACFLNSFKISFCTTVSETSLCNDTLSMNTTAGVHTTRDSCIDVLQEGAMEQKGQSKSMVAHKLER